jgi:DNA polymerase
MRALSLDFETWSEADIKLGAHHYAAHPSTEAIMLAYHVVGDSAPPELWWHGQPIPEALAEHIQRGWPLCAWNAGFERLMWRHVCVGKYGWPEVPDWQWADTMLRAVGANLPRSLDGASRATGASTVKDKAGSALVKELTQAKNTSWAALWSEKKRPKLIAFGQYCITDVLAEEATGAATPPWITAEPWPRMPGVDMRINDRGILADMPLVIGMRKASEYETLRLDAEVARVTNGKIPKLTAVQDLKAWLLERGVRLPLIVDPNRKPEDDVPLDDDDNTDEFNPKRYRLRKNDVIDLLAGDLPEDYEGPDGKPCGRVRDVLQMRADAAKISAKKLSVMERAAGVDGRLRGAFILGGAQTTMRWAGGGGWQPHNLPRNALPDAGYVERQAALILGRKPSGDDKKLLRKLQADALAQAVAYGQSGDAIAIRTAYGPVLPFVSRMLRRTLRAPGGRTLLQGDFAQVEARIIAWLAGQQNIVDAFANGDDVYSIAAAPMVGKPVSEVTKEERQLGKVGVLGCGYGGGTGVFVIMSMAYNIRMNRDQAKPIVAKWRAANAEIVKYWYATSSAAINAVKHPGREFPVGPFGYCSYFMLDGALCCRLPAGRLLRYWAPRLEGLDEWGNPILTALNPRGASVTRRPLYHTILVENQDQAIAADLLAIALDNMDRHGGLPVVLHVHDSIAAEVREDDAERLLPVFVDLMTVKPSWAAGLPTKVDAHISNRFG